MSVSYFRLRRSPDRRSPLRRSATPGGGPIFAFRRSLPRRSVRAPLGLLGQGGLAGRLAHFPLQAHRPPGRIEHFEQPVVRGPGLGIDRRIPESLAQQLRRLENRFPLPALQRVDPEDS